MKRQKLLFTLAADAGFGSVHDMLEEAVADSVAWGICPECLYTTQYEPDQYEGWCEV